MPKSGDKPKYSILLPVYNEVTNLPMILYLLYEVCQKHSYLFEIIIIEDNSEDLTRPMARKLIKIYEDIQSNDPKTCKSGKFFQIKMLQREGKLGLGSAYRDGLELATGDYVVIMDADLSHHPQYLPQMIEKLNSHSEQSVDIVYCSRYCENGGVEGWSFMRKLTSRTANYIASMVLGSSFSDLTGSYRIYKKEVLEELMAQTTTKGYSFQMEILIRAWKSKKVIVEQPIVFVDRIYGKSKLGPNEVWVYLKGVFKLFLDY